MTLLPNLTISFCLTLSLFLTCQKSSVIIQKDPSVEQAHSVLWNHRIDAHGVILDFIGEIPNSEDCSLGRPNAIGWWSPIENGPMFTGMYLVAACERAKRSGDPVDKENARRLAQGLIKCASVSDVKGFIARGMGTDGKCHYPLGSDDQTHPWFYGLHAYYISNIPSKAERNQISAKMTEVANVLESTSWRCPCDGAFKGQFRGSYQGHLFRDAARYLFMLRAMYDVTLNKYWLERYRTSLVECPADYGKTRLQICAEGYLPDRSVINGIEDWGFWIYVGSQGSLKELAAMENDESVKSQYKAGLKINAENALPSVEKYKSFDNSDKKVFGHANWREGYPTWFPQVTQADAQRLSDMGDKTKLGDRKNYEARYMRHPLAAAAIVALAGNDIGRESIGNAIHHYDYSKINMSEFFFAEVAYYALPEKK